MKNTELTAHDSPPGTTRSLQQQREEASAETEKKLVAAFDGLVAELEQRKVPFTSGKSWGGRYSITVRAADDPKLPSLEIEVRSEHGSRAFSPKIEKIRIVVGRYRDKRAFLERKVGFDFKEIVDDILQRFERAKASDASTREHMALRAQLEDQAERINTLVGPIPAATVRVYQSGGLRVEADNLSEDQALAVMRLLQSFHKGTT
jgi:hypothetical protein